jgi:quercetin dioxygenase-like cupin family protein
MKIIASSERSRRRAPEAWFTGEVWMDDVVTGTAPSRLQAVYVTFEPKARTAWHTHPVGQVLQVISGGGWVQLEGEPARKIGIGDVAVIGAGENHWHGANSAGEMRHLAMQEADDSGKNVVWGEKVTDAEYDAAG